MKLINSSVQILDEINEAEVISKIVKVARTCYKSEDASTPDKDKALVKRLIQSGHEAMIEHYSISVKFICDRGVSHELVRHRMASFAQESTRYCNYSKDKFDNELTFICPNWLNCEEMQHYVNIANIDNKAIYEMGHDENLQLIDRAKCSFIYDMSNSEHGYLFQIKCGWLPQQARSILPNAIKTEVNMTTNLREWRHFFKLRCATAAHPDMRVLALDLLKQMYIAIPTVFEDLYKEFINEENNN
mgnify:CR=1 FL=1